MLIESSRYTRADREAWDARERADAVWCKLDSFRAAQRRSMDAIRDFVDRSSDGPCYCGVSWGKDSVVVADLIASIAPHVPLVWVRIEPVSNPDCALVRDAFLRSHPHCIYEEIEVWSRQDSEGGWHWRGTLESGFAEATKRHGKRYISGIRAEESGTREMRMRKYGEAAKMTCAPIGWWTARDVFAHLHARKLPVHPAYACSMGGLLDRERIRVASLGGKRGQGMGRAEWERRYYAECLAKPGAEHLA